MLATIIEVRVLLSDKNIMAKNARLMQARGVLEDRAYEDLDNYNKKIGTYEELSLDATAWIPGTAPEKRVYNYLSKLEVAFDFQYHYEDNPNTAYPEDTWIPDFKLPDYNIKIEVYGNYWHSLPKTSAKDSLKKAYWLTAGWEVVENGITATPSGGNRTGKVIIWWENEIYAGLSELFMRDMPEVLVHTKKGTVSESNFDASKEFEKRYKAQAARTARKLRPKIQTPRVQYKKLVTRIRKDIFDLRP